MANPQKEDGHTQIANEILEQLSLSHLSPNQWQVVIFIVRKTYGYRKKVDYMVNSQIGMGTGLSKSVVSRVLKRLDERNIIIRHKKNIGFQKDWEKWKLAKQSTIGTKLPKQQTSESCPNSQPKLAKQSTKVDSPDDTQKKKETIQKKGYGEFSNVLLSDEEHQKLVDRFGEAKTNGFIDGLSEGIESKGYKYKSHYAAILSWVRRDEKDKPKDKRGADGW